ncbi:MAG: antibiotic biosynthesis monooxygenase [Gammaproteobacteria bacterium]
MASSKGSHVVIFRARHRADIADDYLPTVLALKERALADYGCLEFVYATTPEGEEIAITFWPDEAAIQRWKADEEHRAAQRQNARWYDAYRIQVGEIRRDYGRGVMGD